jgi:hypothetical protein
MHSNKSTLDLIDPIAATNNKQVEAMAAEVRSLSTALKEIPNAKYLDPLRCFVHY